MTRHVFAFAFFLALAIAMTWPLATNLSTAVPDLGDPLLNAWIVDWAGHALTHAPLDLFDAPIYHPARNMLAFSEHMTGIAIFVMPFRLAGLPAIAVYNIALLLGFAFSAYGAFVLARVITNNTAAALVAGVVHAFASFKIAHVQHLQVVWSGWLPLILAALLLYWREPNWKRAALLAVVFVMNGLTNIYFLLFAGFALVVTIAFLQFAEPRRERVFWLRLCAALVIASLVLLPFLIPYQLVSEEYGEKRTTAEARGGSATPLDWLVASSRNVVYGSLLRGSDEKELFPGVVALALMIVGFVASRPLPLTSLRGARGLDVAIVVFFAISVALAFVGKIPIGSRTIEGADVPAMITTILILIRVAPHVRVRSVEQASAALWIVVGFFGSLGWNFFLHPFLFRLITPFRATRVPARWAAIAYVGIAVFAAIGAAVLIARVNPKVRHAIAAVLVALAILDVAARVDWRHVPPAAPIYTDVRGARSMIELPMAGDTIPFIYLLAQTEHRVPLVNGTSGFETPTHRVLREKEARMQYDDAFLQNAELLLVHEARLSDEQRAALRPLLEKLEPVKRAGSDALFRIPRGPADIASAPRAALPR